jgi:hypothetical protein
VPGSLLYGLNAVARRAGLSEIETMRRIQSGEIRAEMAGTVPIVVRAELDALQATPHFNRRADQLIGRLAA